MDKKIEDVKKDLAKSSSSTFKQALVMIKSTSVGFLFGFVLEKSKVYDSQIIIDQMVFKRFIMIKMFFSALAASTFVILVYRTLSPQAYAKILDSGRDQLKKTPLLSLIIGGIILGFGMTIVGSCPGMVFVQIGAGVSNAYFTLLGGLLGAIVHGCLNDTLNGLFGKPYAKASNTLYEIANKTPSFMHLALGGGLLGAVTLFEILFPWRADFNIDSSINSYALSSTIWPPIFAGTLLGTTQLFSFLLTNRSLGSSTSFSIAASQFFSSSWLEKNAYLKKWKTGNWDRLIMSAGVLAGSLLSASMSGVYGKTAGVSMASSLAGGFLLVFGARIAGGCNTGHGISGTAHMLVGSAVATMAMFAGAMGLALFI